MASNDYHFVTRWRFQASAEEVSEILNHPEDLARWWPSVYLDVKITRLGDARGVGRTVDLYTKGWLPYTLRWQFETTRSDAPRGFELVAKGDFVGRGIWTFEPDGEFVNVVYDWKIAADKPLLRYLSFVLKPFFRWNHEWAMARGEESLALELRRRHAKTDEERNQIPAPRGPTRPIW